MTSGGKFATCSASDRPALSINAGHHTLLELRGAATRPLGRDGLRPFRFR